MRFVNKNKTLCSKGWVDKQNIRKRTAEIDRNTSKNKSDFQSSRLGVKEEVIRKFYNEDAY